MAGYLFEYASAAKSPARMSLLLLHLLVRFSVSKQLFAPSKTMADSPTDIDVVFRLQAPERREGTLLLGGPFADPHSCGPCLSEPHFDDQPRRNDTECSERSYDYAKDKLTVSRLFASIVASLKLASCSASQS